VHAAGVVAAALETAWSWVSALTAGTLLSINTEPPWPAPA